MSGSRMFPFITKTWNPLGGECLHHCSYCWAKALIEKSKNSHIGFYAKYTGNSRFERCGLSPRFKPGDFVFVQDMTDLFGSWVSRTAILEVLDVIRNTPEARFLLLTKNPGRYVEFLPMLQRTNCLLGVTLETNRDTGAFSKAPFPVERWEVFYELEYSPKFVSIEPIMNFDLNIFADWLLNITGLDSVAVGYDNYGNRLPEPPLAKTMRLIEALEKAGIKVFRKTLREACC